MLSALEIRRRIFHLTAGIIIVLLIYYDILNVFLLAIVTFIAAILSLLTLRYKIPIIYWLLVKLDRRKDRKAFPGKGALFYIFGTLIVMLFFYKNTAMASVLIMALGDSIAPLVGQFGAIRHPFDRKKFIEGTIAGMAAAALGAMIFVPVFPAIIASIAAMTAEAIRIKIWGYSINDNISMPLTAGIVIWAVMLI